MLQLCPHIWQRGIHRAANRVQLEHVETTVTHLVAADVVLREAQPRGELRLRQMQRLASDAQMPAKKSLMADIKRLTSDDVSPFPAMCSSGKGE